MAQRRPGEELGPRSVAALRLRVDPLFARLGDDPVRSIGEALERAGLLQPGWSPTDAVDTLARGLGI